jgi:hypothetical protein
MLQPLSSFTALQPFIQYEPWLADPAVFAECMWEQGGRDGHRYAFYLFRNGGSSVLGVLLRDGCWHYGRLHANEVMAARDATAWLGDIASDSLSDMHALVCGGFDRRHRVWAVRVVRRGAGRWELHIAHGGLIPNVSDFLDQESAQCAAEMRVTDFHLGES